jgi:hypothetical protein
LRFNRLASISACSRVRYTTGAPSKPFNGSAVPRVDEAWRTITHELRSRPTGRACLKYHLAVIGEQLDVPGLRPEKHGEAAAPEPSRARAPCGLAQYALYLGESFGDRHDHRRRRAQKKPRKRTPPGLVCGFTMKIIRVHHLMSERCYPSATQPREIAAVRGLDELIRSVSRPARLLSARSVAGRLQSDRGISDRFGT